MSAPVRTLAAALTIAALAAPAAPAMPIDGPVDRTPASPQEPTVPQGEAFDWGDAGIGAAGALAIVTLAGGAVAIAGGRGKAAQTTTR